MLPGLKITQTKAILMHLGRVNGLVPDPKNEQANIDADMIREFFNDWLAATTGYCFFPAHRAQVIKRSSPCSKGTYFFFNIIFPRAKSRRARKRRPSARPTRLPSTASSRTSTKSAPSAPESGWSETSWPTWILSPMRTLIRRGCCWARTFWIRRPISKSSWSGSRSSRIWRSTLPRTGSNSFRFSLREPILDSARGTDAKSRLWYFDSK